MVRGKEKNERVKGERVKVRKNCINKKRWEGELEEDERKWRKLM